MKIEAHVINRLPELKLGFILPHEINLTRTRFVVFLLSMMAKENDGSIIILRVNDVTQHEIWCLMKHFHGGLQKKKNY